MKLSRLTMGVVLALSSSVFGMTGCVSSGDEATEEASYGTVAMSLTGQTNGTTYRLRNALFQVAGPTSTSLDSELDPDAALLAATLATGSYSIELEAGWFLERLDAGTFQPVSASLISANPAAFDVVSSTTTNVVFTFETDGQIIDIGTGSLSVSIAVVETSGGECDLLGQTGCPAGERCYFDGVSGGVCQPAGIRLPGQLCVAQNDCAAPAFCASTDGVNTQCFQACGADGSGPTCPAGQSCIELGVGNFGACL